jgi:hypothetical protein
MLLARLLYRKTRKYIRHETREMPVDADNTVGPAANKISEQRLKNNASVRFWGERSMDSVFFFFFVIWLRVAGQVFPVVSKDRRIHEPFKCKKTPPTTRRHAPEEPNPQQRRYESLQSCTAIYKC